MTNRRNGSEADSSSQGAVVLVTITTPPVQWRFNRCVFHLVDVDALTGYSRLSCSFM